MLVSLWPVALAALVSCATSPVAPAAAPLPVGGATVVDVPFHHAGDDAVLFPIRIAGHARELTFALDSGAAVSYLDEDVARELGLVPSEQGTVEGSGSKRLHVGRIDGVTFELGPLQSRGYAENTMTLGGVQPGGMLGTETLRRFNVTFDYARARLILEPNSHLGDVFR